MYERGSGDEGGEDLGEMGGGRVRCARPSRMESILESMVDWIWAKDAWF